MGNIDLDMARAQRAAVREGKGEAPTVTLQGRVFALPVEMPFDVVGHVARAEMGQISALGPLFRELLGDEYGELLALKPSIDDMNELLGQMLVEYGLVEGESSASES